MKYIISSNWGQYGKIKYVDKKCWVVDHYVWNAREKNLAYSFSLKEARRLVLISRKRYDWMSNFRIELK